MKVSVCITTLNEEKNIGRLLTALLNQTKKADEIIIVDGGSIDQSAKIIRHFQKKDKSIKFLKEKSSIAQGRNIGVGLAKNEVIAFTDAGCEPYPDWLEKITYFFKYKEVGVVAGFYDMAAPTPLAAVIGCYLGIPGEKFDPVSFLPSNRSAAVRKSVWEELGGFNEKLKRAGEDTLFFSQALRKGIKIVRAKEAKVLWFEIGELSLGDFFKKIAIYAEGDFRTGIWFHSGQVLMSHNIKIILVFLRYFFFLFLLLKILTDFSLFWLVFDFSVFLAYLIWPIWKWRRILKKPAERLWLPLVQITADFGVMKGFLSAVFADLTK